MWITCSSNRSREVLFYRQLHDMQNKIWVLYKRKTEKIDVGKVTNSDLESIRIFWLNEYSEQRRQFSLLVRYHGCSKFKFKVDSLFVSKCKRSVKTF